MVSIKSCCYIKRLEDHVCVHVGLTLWDLNWLSHREYLRVLPCQKKERPQENYHVVWLCHTKVVFCTYPRNSREEANRGGSLLGHWHGKGLWMRLAVTALFCAPKDSKKKKGNCLPISRMQHGANNVWICCFQSRQWHTWRSIASFMLLFT